MELLPLLSLSVIRYPFPDSYRDVLGVLGLWNYFLCCRYPLSVLCVLGAMEFLYLQRKIKNM